MTWGGLPLFVAILIVRIIVAASQARAGTQGKPSAPVSPRVKALGRFIFLWLLACPLAGYIALAPPRTLVTYVPGSLFLVSVVVWPLARYVIAPLGLVKAAYYVALSAWAQNEERSSLALLAASVALMRKSSFDPEAAAWLEDKIQAERGLRGAAIAAAAVTALARGDKEGARVLFESLRTLDSRVCGPASRHTAAEWIAATAAESGKWDEVIDLGGDIVANGRTPWLLAAVGKRLLGRSDAPTRAQLVLRWAFAPHRIGTFPIVERALSVPDGAVPIVDDEDDDAPPAPVAPEGDLLARAIAMQVQLLRAKEPTPVDVARVGRAFDEALGDEALARHIEERAASLGANRSEGALGRMRADIEESLFQLLKRHRMALDDTADDLGEIAGNAQRRLRDETLTVIEALSDAVKNRVAERRALSPIDEWREWSALRMAYERGLLLGGPELRYLAFTKVHTDVCALAVWLFNDRKEKPIANAMFRFLLAEATAVGDAAGIELQTKNVTCGL